MNQEMFGCQCPRCQRWRAYRMHTDTWFDAEIEKRLRDRIHPVRTLPPVANEWEAFLANVRGALKFISSAVRSITMVRLN